MEVWNLLLQGFGVALQPINLGWALVGVTLGTIVGVLPGLGPAVSIALLLPLTTKIEPAGALIMFAGIYYGAMYGGSTTSILLNTPGESATIVTAMEGNQMAKRGRAGPALCTAAVGSFVAGTIATVLLTVLAPQVVTAVQALTKHGEDEPYEAFVRRAARNPIARAVKLADLHDSMDLARIAQPTARDVARIEKYRNAVRIIESETLA